MTFPIERSRDRPAAKHVVRAILVIALTAFGGGFVGGAVSQVPTVNVRMERANTADAVKTFADRSRPLDERLSAAARIGHLGDKSLADQVIAVLRQREESDAIRAAALTRAPLYDRTDIVQVIVDIVRDPGNGGPSLKVPAIEALQVIDGFTPAGGHHGAGEGILEALRAALKHSAAEVRNAAMAALAVRNDPEAIKILTSTLQGGDTGFAVDDAIRFLGVGDVSRHYEIIRPQLKAPNAAVRQAAATVLASDQNSRDAIRAIFIDPAESVQLRSAVLESLAGSDTEFPKYAIRVANDEKAQHTLRAKTISALGHALKATIPSATANDVRATLRTLSTHADPVIKDAARAALAREQR